MLSLDSQPHPPRVVTRWLIVLGLVGGTLLVSVAPAAASTYCVDVRPQETWGTTVCTP
jgi:hypothetical protein